MERRLGQIRGDARKRLEEALAEQQIIEQTITESGLPHPYAQKVRDSFVQDGFGIEALKIRRDARRRKAG